MSVAADIMGKQIDHAMGEHDRPVWRCPDCASRLHAEMLAIKEMQGDALLGHCHEPSAEHAWYHLHAGTWVRPAEARPFA